MDWGALQPPLCQYSDRHIHYFIRGTVDILTVEDFQSQSVTVEVRRYTVTNEVTSG